ncbi:MAG: hypothetical protein Q9169_006925 [Polycauliona sp. 2 TL-2023]
MSHEPTFSYFSGSDKAEAPFQLALAVGSFSAKILTIISDYYKDVKGARDDIRLLTNELEYSRDVMQTFQGMADGSSKLPVAASLDAAINQALSDLKGLEDKLVPGTGTNLMRRFGKRALKWPFEKGEVERRVTSLQRLMQTANLALGMEQK